MSCFEDIYRKTLAGKSLCFEDARAAMEAVMDGSVSAVKLAAWLVALNIKGESAEEIAGCAAAMMERAVKVESTRSGLTDLVGTGGDGMNTFNISTAAAFVAAGAGLPVAKHGNVAASSKSGSADVLRALGVDLDLGPEEMAAALDAVGIAFLFAKRLHPAMRHAAPVRSELGVRTIFNILGPLCNPAGTRRMLIGACSERLLGIMLDAAKTLGKERVMVVRGEDGIDELTVTTRTRIREFREGETLEYELEPLKHGIPRASLKDIAGGSPEENAETIKRIFDGELRGAPRDIVVLNAAAALLVGGIAESWDDALAKALDSIDSGEARCKLDELVVFTRAVRKQ